MGGALQVSGVLAFKRSSDDTANVQRVKKASSGCADPVQSLKAEGLLVSSNLENAISRRIANRCTGLEMPLAEFGDDLRA
jgi:hypothetical protein